MERRGFLQAMVTAISASTATLALKKTDAGLLVPDQPIVLAPQRVVPVESSQGMLYDAHGNAVLFVQSVSINCSLNDVTTASVEGYLVDMDHSYRSLVKTIHGVTK